MQSGHSKEQYYNRFKQFTQGLYKNNRDLALLSILQVFDSAGGVYVNDPFYPPGGEGV